MKEPLKEVRRALLEADVSLPVVRGFVKRVEEEALGMEVVAGVSAEQMLIKAVYDQLVGLMGGEARGLEMSPVEGDPQVVLMAGLQGTGMLVDVLVRGIV
jgi:signal recognition particle subunit SRP54